MIKKIFALCLCLMVLSSSGIMGAPIANAASSSTYVQRYKTNYPQYLKNDKVIADAFLSNYNNSESQALAARAIWYMENGYMIYGHSKYWDTGFIDCSNFVSLVYKDFGYKITSASKNYSRVGSKVAGVYSRKIKGSSKYELVGIEKLRPGDIFTFWKADSNGKGTHIGHVALYIGKINGQPTVIQTVSGRPTAIGITNDFRYWYGEHFAGARRVLDDTSQYAGKAWKASKPVIPAKYQLSPQKSVVMPGSKFMAYQGINSTRKVVDATPLSTPIKANTAVVTPILTKDNGQMQSEPVGSSDSNTRHFTFYGTGSYHSTTIFPCLYTASSR